MWIKANSWARYNTNLTEATIYQDVHIKLNLGKIEAFQKYDIIRNIPLKTNVFNINGIECQINEFLARVCNGTGRFGELEAARAHSRKAGGRGLQAAVPV
jgi:hypothetical protein